MASRLPARYGTRPAGVERNSRLAKAQVRKLSSTNEPATSPGVRPQRRATRSSSSRERRGRRTERTAVFTMPHHTQSSRKVKPEGAGKNRRNQYTNTSTAAFSADFTTSSNFTSFVFGSLSLAETSGTDSRKPSRKLLFTA